MPTTRLPGQVLEILLEAVVVVVALFGMTYLYALSGVDGFMVLFGFSALYLGIVLAVTVASYRAGWSRPKRATVGLALAVPGLALAGKSVVADGILGPAFVLLLVVGLWANAPDPVVPSRPEASLLTTVFALAILFGAFPHVGSNLLPVSRFPQLTISYYSTSNGAIVFGVETPVVVFGAPNFSVSVYLLQVAVGAIGYGLGRAGMERTATGKSATSDRP